jgi:hypothetical protein
VAELNERVEDAAPPLVRARLVWVRDAVTPGVAETASVTVPVKLFRLLRAIVEDPEEGLTKMVCDVGLADAEKSDTLTLITVE